jgi:hypothetical protein
MAGILADRLSAVAYSRRKTRRCVCWFQYPEKWPTKNAYWIEMKRSVLAVDFLCTCPDKRLDLLLVATLRWASPFTELLA